jgi:hypothetical protein
MISCLLTSSTSPSQQRCARCKMTCEWLGLQVGAQWWAAKYLSNPAKFKFRDFIREIKQRADLAWSWAVQMVTGTLTLSSD